MWGKCQNLIVAVDTEYQSESDATSYSAAHSFSCAVNMLFILLDSSRLCLIGTGLKKARAEGKKKNVTLNKHTLKL